MSAKQKLEQKLSGECSCHLSSPCHWCTSLDEDEAEAFWAGGREAVIKLIDEKLDALEIVP